MTEGSVGINACTVWGSKVLWKWEAGEKWEIQVTSSSTYQASRTPVRCCFTKAFLASADPARQTHDEQESGESPALCRLSCCTCASVSPCEELQSCITQFAGFIGICKSKVWANSKAHLCTLPQYQQKKQEFSFGCLLCVLLSACVLCLQSNLFWDRSCWASDY